MRSVRGFSLAAALCLSVAWPATAPARTANGAASEVVATRFSLVKVSDLSFGAVFPSTTAGTVVVSPAGVRTVTGGVTAATSTVHAALFAGYGYNGDPVAISVSSNTPTMTRVGGTQTMTFDTFVIGSTPVTTLSTTPRTFTIGSVNSGFQFGLGATLRVRGNQTPGQYVGNFTLTVNYQ